LSHLQKMKNKKKNKTGGVRVGSGRKPTGRTTVSKSVALRPATWEKIDLKKAEKSRSKFIDDLVNQD